MNILAKVFSTLYNRTLYRLKVKQQLAEIPGLLAYLWKVRKEPELKEISEYVKSNPKAIMPYDFTEKYKEMDVEICRDARSKYVQANVNGNCIYFPESFSIEYVLESIRVGLMEQDDQSPHRYIHSPGEKLSGRYAVLAGASDCMFALRIVRNFERVFLFEADTQWHGPMHETMKVFPDKVEIVPKFIGDKETDTSVTLDSFFRKRYKDVNFIQADIEGNEVKMLSGAEQLLNESKELKLSVCCYHEAYHEAEIGDFLRARGYDIRPANGYMLLWMHYPLQYPYLRRGVLYASRRRNPRSNHSV